MAIDSLLSSTKQIIIFSDILFQVRYVYFLTFCIKSKEKEIFAHISQILHILM